MNGSGEYRAIVDADNSLSLEDVIQTMEYRHSSLTTADMKAYAEDYNRTIARLLLDGNRINTGLIQFSLSIKGNFTDEDDLFDPGRHQLAIQINPTRSFQQTVEQEARLERKRTVEPTPQLTRFFNLEGSAPDTELTPTHMARLKGQNLAFDQTDPEQGLFIVPANGNGQETNGEIRVDRLSLATRSQIIFRVPDTLPPGPYRLEVRAVFGSSDLRTGRLKQVLEVV